MEMTTCSKPTGLVETEPLDSALSPTPGTLRKLGSAELHPFPIGRQAVGEGLWGPDRPLLPPALLLWSCLYVEWPHEMQKGC